MIMIQTASGVLALSLVLALPCAGADRVLRAELTIDAPAPAVFQAWTTREGIRSWFAPDGDVADRVDGPYAIYFDPDAPPGHRGADGMRILQLEPPRRFAFTWNSPETWPELRRQRTIVIVDLEPLSGDRTRMTLTHLGWGHGAEWDEVYHYFDKAWRASVLPRLVERFRSGPVDWTKRLDLPPVAATLEVELSAR